MAKGDRRVVNRLRRGDLGNDPIRGTSTAGLNPKRGRPAKNPKEKKLRRRLAQQKYRASPRGRYQQHKFHAKHRGVPFELTFSQWLEIWDESGHFDERGNHTGSGYVMRRIGDKGAYAVGNVYIGTHSDNIAERNRAYHWSRRQRMVDESEPDYAHVHSCPDVDSSKPVPGARDPDYPEVPF